MKRIDTAGYFARPSVAGDRRFLMGSERPLFVSEWAGVTWAYTSFYVARADRFADLFYFHNLDLKPGTYVVDEGGMRLDAHHEPPPIGRIMEEEREPSCLMVPMRLGRSLMVVDMVPGPCLALRVDAQTIGEHKVGPVTAAVNIEYVWAVSARQNRPGINDLAFKGQGEHPEITPIRIFNGSDLLGLVMPVRVEP